MAKIYGLFGAMTGRVADVVMAVNRGQQVVRKYQPVVANPSTSAQVGQRAKMKLASQLAATLAPELGGFKRDGAVSSRNLFIKDLFNRSALTYTNMVANVNLDDIALTTSRVSPLINVTVTGNQTGATVQGTITPDYEGKIMGIRIVVVAPRLVSRDEHEVAIIRAMTAVPEGLNFSVEVPFGRSFPANVLIYAYWPESEAAVTRYMSMVASGTTPEVSLEVIRREVASGLEYSITTNRSVPV